MSHALSWEEKIEAKWEQLKGTALEEWGLLTIDDVAYCLGKRDRLLGKVMERYGLTHEEADQKVSEWAEKTIAESAASHP